MNPAFVHLHLHSGYSLLRGVGRIGELVARSRALGFDALALTDTNGLYGAVEFMQTARRAGLKPIIGAEITHESGTAVCLARNRKGYANLCRLVTARQLQKDFQLSESLPAHQEGLFILSHDENLLVRLIGRVAPENLVREVSPFPHAWRAQIPGVKKLPPVATNNVHFITPEAYDTHRVLTAVRLNKLLSSVKDNELASPQAWLKSSEDMAQALPGAEGREAMANTRRIADACNLEIEMGKPIFPRYFNLPDVRRRFPQETPHSALRRVALNGARTLYRPITQPVIERLEYELDVIHQLGFVEYFLIVWDIVNFARRKKNPHRRPRLSGQQPGRLHPGYHQRRPVAPQLVF